MTPDQFTVLIARLDAIRDALTSRPHSAPSAPPNAAPASNGSGSGACFPNYGKSKGAPVSGATVRDLEFYRGGCIRTLGDPAKSRWHDKERVLLAAIDAELAKHGITNEPPHDTTTGEVQSTFPADDSDIPF